MLTNDVSPPQDAQGSRPMRFRFHRRQRVSAETCQARRSQSAAMEKVVVNGSGHNMWLSLTRVMEL